MYPDETARKEIGIYYEDAFELASARAWNRREIEYFRGKARKRAVNEVKKRGFVRENFIENAYAYIEDFIQENMQA